MARPRSRKRAAAEAGGSSKTAMARLGKRSKTMPQPSPEAEHFAERRNLEDLWSSAFPIGTEWEHIDKIKEFNRNFQNLEKALEEGGELYGKTVYLFANTEPQQLHVKGEEKMVLVPTIVTVDCPCAPSDKIGINSVQRAYEEILPMRAMKMSWVPYVPLQDWLNRIEGLKKKYPLFIAPSEGLR